MIHTKSRIYFCKDPLYTAAILVNKLYKQYHITIYGNLLKEFDEKLWTFNALSFIPHTLYEDHISIDIENEQEIKFSLFEIKEQFVSFMYLHQMHEELKATYQIYYQTGDKYIAL